MKSGQKREANRKFFPGYIIINMHLLHDDNTLVDRTWYFIQETDGVINFAGTKDSSHAHADARGRGYARTDQGARRVA